MLLVIDVGNTNTVLGVYDGAKLVRDWRVVTRRDRTADEYGLQFKHLLSLAELECGDIEGISISCVVPPLLPVLLEVGRNFFGIADPLVVSPGVKTGISVHVDNPREVGADRIVNAVAAFETWRTAVIVVDFGTATTFDYVSSKGVFEGGIIAPGLAISTEALFKEASKLPRVELTRPRRVIGKSTVAAMQSGIVFGYAGMVDAMIDRIKDEARRDWPDEPEPKVVATGGLATLLAPETRSIHEVDPDLTLRGLQIIYQRNREQ
jgi:type III pantothenate kinase